MSRMCVYIYIRLFIYICDDMNICYLLLIIRCALVLFLGWGLSTERVVAQPLHLFLFLPGVIAIGGMQTCFALCDSFSLCICTLDLMFANDKLCNSYVSLNVILFKIKLCNAFI